MSSKLFAILTVLVIGIVSFLIGKLLTSSKWKNKYLEADTQYKLLEKRKISVENTLKEVKEKEQAARKKITELLTTNRSKDQSIKDLEQRISKTAKSTPHSEESYKKVLDALKMEKKKVMDLEAQLAIKAIPSKKKISTSTSTFKSYDNDGLGTAKVLDTKSQYKGLMASILNRMSMFNNLEELDDLTKINGINRAIADKLQEEGVRNYKQMAMLEKKDFPIVAKVTGVTPTQIQNHNWVGVARDLYHRKYKVDL